MTLRHVPLGNISAVNAAARTVIELPTNRTYHALFLEVRSGGTLCDLATMIATVDKVRLKINGKQQREYTVSQLVTANALNGRTFEAGFLPIFFAEPWRREIAGEDALAWGTADVSSFQVEVDIAAGATSPSLSGFTSITYSNVPLGLIKKVKSQVIPVNASGVHTHTIVRPVDAQFRALCFEDTAGDIGGVKLKLDGVELYELTAARNNMIAKQHGLVPQAALFPIIYDIRQRYGDAQMFRRAADGAVSVAQELRIDFDMTAGRGFVFQTEEIGPAD
jgi:hypothetical protein